MNTIDTIWLHINQLINTNYFTNWKSAWNNRNEYIFYTHFDNYSFSYNTKYNSLTLKTSITKFLYGANHREFDFDDLDALYIKLNTVITNTIAIPLPDIKE